MRYKIAPALYKKIKRVDVRLQNGFWESLEIFEQNPDDPRLDKHRLKGALADYLSIDVVGHAAYAIHYEEVDGGDEITAYISAFGHKKNELYLNLKVDKEEIPSQPLQK